MRAQSASLTISEGEIRGLTLQNAFDTRAACFDPEQASALAVAYKMALHSIATQSETATERLSTRTKSKLAKVVVNLGRERRRQRLELDAEAISVSAARFVNQLRARSLLD